MFRCVYIYLLLVIFLGSITGQFSNPFINLSNIDSASSKNTTRCTPEQKSCAPWCTTKMDGNGCMLCQCNTGGMNQLGGLSLMVDTGSMNPMSGALNPMRGSMNPMSGALNPMRGSMNPMQGGNPMRPGINPFASMYSSLISASLSSQHVDNHTGNVECKTAPTTCPVPQPWCQRLPDAKACIRCVCGKELITLLSKNVLSTTQQPIITKNTSTQQPTTMTVTTTALPETTNQMKSCVDNFFCSKICDHGYKTNKINCPVCECMDGTTLSSRVDGTDSTADVSTHSTTTTGSPVLTDHVTSCPGIFDCGLICYNGYKTDIQGCPVCQCEL